MQMEPLAADGTQCIHVQLQGGAPWGFTLKGGLEHGEPLIISKIEDGGKASLSEKMEVGDELVNINGTPLYGSRQEALILIKGSYKILKMIVQSELPMHWNPLSRHCSTDKSSSIGSMESLDQPGQNYYEGTLSPIDSGMYQNKRDSAYSSFSASSNASDYTVSARAEESSPMDCILQGLGTSKQGDGRYLQTGQPIVDPPEANSSQTLVENSQRPSSFPCDGNHLGIIKSPPQPPVRRDSLRSSKNQLSHCEKRRASAPIDSLQVPRRWTLDTEKHNYETVRCQCGLGLCTVHLKENLLSDQYYMLSSQSDKIPQCNEKNTVSDQEQHNFCTKTHQGLSSESRERRINSSELKKGSCCTVQQIKDPSPFQLPFPQNKSSLSPTSHRENPSCHSDFRSSGWNMAQSQGNGHCLKNQCNGESSEENLSINPRNEEVTQVNALTSSDRIELSDDGQPCASLETSASALHKTSETHLALKSKHCIGGLKQSDSPETPHVGNKGSEEIQMPTKKPGSSRHRSAQMRRKSDRFATNLRNEIQRRKAQLQKSKGSVLNCEEEPMDEREEPDECQSPPRPVPPPPPPKNKSLLLKIKKANAEHFNKYVDNPIVEQKIHAVTENIELKNIPERDVVENTPKTSENGLNEGLSLNFRSQAPNIIHRADSIECVQHDSSIYEHKLKTNLKNEELFSNVKSESPPRGRMLSRSKSCYEKQRIVVNDVPKNIDIQSNEMGSISELTAGTAKWNMVSRAASVPDMMESDDMLKTDFSHRNGSKMSGDRFAKNLPEDTILHNHMPLTPGSKSNSPQTNLQLVYSEASPKDDWKVESLGNMDQDQRFQETKPHDIGQLGGCSSNTVLWKSANPSQNYDDHSTMQLPNNGQQTCSPELKLHPHTHMSKRSSQDMSCIEASIPPITRIIEESVLMPFADRRRFFEDNSKPPMTYHIPLNLNPGRDNICLNVPDQPISQAICDLRRHSIDYAYHPSSPSRPNNAVPCSECYVNHPVDPPLCCNQGGHSPECLHSIAYGCRVHESCMYCSSDLCPGILNRNMASSHLSCHCRHRHHHHHHQWSRCSDRLCPSQNNTLEDGSSIHGDPWHARKPLLQEAPLKEWTQQMKINRKCSQSVSELCHYNSGRHRSGPYRPCCEGSDQEWSQYYRTVSSCDLSCDHPIRPTELPLFQDGSPNPGLARGRAYSVSQLNLESLRDRREMSLAKLEETEQPAPMKKQGPPRPPPPNWEKYRERRASHQIANSGLPDSKEKVTILDHNTTVEAAKQRSQSLPMNQAFLKIKEAFHHSPYDEFPSGDYDHEPSEFTPEPEGSPCYQNTRDDQHSSPPPSVDRLAVGTLKGNFLPSEATSPASKQEYIPNETEDVINVEDLDSNLEGDAADSNFHPKDPFAKSMTTDIGGSVQAALLDELMGSYRHYEDEWSTDRESEISIPDRYEFQPISPPPVCGAVSPTSCAAYYNTSAAKAELLNKMKDLDDVQKEGLETNGLVEEEEELALRKMQLIDSISKKLSVLHEAQRDLQEEIGANTALGGEVGDLLKHLCKPNEYDKFRIFIGDLDKVVNLLLSLSGRLARVESALSSEDPEPSMEEKLSLLEKKKQLSDQLEDATELKAHVNRREQVVLEVVSRYLNEDQLQDYQHYVKMTSALIVEQRELEDKIRLGEEQLRCLRESL
uniref:Shroom family member 4 n=1 Tax=Leptobrachium leishanense TaxID=445787 RepID=A0A8C5MX47_9ANUR